VITYKSQHFYKGFQFKAFPFKSLDSSASVKPNHEELSNFQTTISQNSQSKLNRHTANYNEYSSEDEKKVNKVLKETLNQGGATTYAKGDKISIVKTDLKGMKGTVISIEDGQV